MSLLFIQVWRKRASASPINVRRGLSSAGAAFSDPKSARLLVSAHSVESLPWLRGLPEVIVTGRANVGKSTLLNLVLGRKNLMSTSRKAGRTRALNFCRVGREPGKLVVVDTPGYGALGRTEWGRVFDHYIEHRKELRRVYILINAKHGINQYDLAMLHSLNARCQASSACHFTLQAIITKADQAPWAQKQLITQIADAAPTCLPPIVTSAQFSPPLGIKETRQSIAQACGLSV